MTWLHAALIFVDAEALAGVQSLHLASPVELIAYFSSAAPLEFALS